MGHKHTHLLAAAFTALAAVQFSMVLNLQSQINDVVDSANFTAAVSMNAVAHPSRAERRLILSDSKPMMRGGKDARVLMRKASRQ